MMVWSALPGSAACRCPAIHSGRSGSQSEPGQLLVQPVIADAELGAQPLPRPATDEIPILQVLLQPSEAELCQADLAVLLARLSLLDRADGGRGGGTLPPGRRHPANLVLVQQPPQGRGGDAKLLLNLPQRPRLGDQPILQVGPHPLKVQCGGAIAGA